MVLVQVPDSNSCPAGAPDKGCVTANYETGTQMTNVRTSAKNLNDVYRQGAACVRTMFNISTRRVGGIRFLKIGRITISIAVARTYKPL